MRRPSKKVLVELERIRVENGGMLSPEHVVREAAKKRNPLHSTFEWDEGIAAHQFRIVQARALIRACVTILPRGSRRPVRVYYSLKADRGIGGYRTTVDVMSDSQLRAQLLAEAKAEMVQFQMKYARLKELVGVFRAMAKVK